MSHVQCPMSEVPCLAEAEDPDNSWSTGAWLWSSSILFSEAINLIQLYFQLKIYKIQLQMNKGMFLHPHDLLERRNLIHKGEIFLKRMWWKLSQLMTFYQWEIVSNDSMKHNSTVGSLKRGLSTLFLTSVHDPHSGLY